ncbi:MAG: hypothetical protein U5K27_02215 [Desulfotignum sp.]|nr:hypothetical protein [Desulfotignum sp.]
MHTYGRARSPEQIRQMAEAVVQWQPDVSIPSVEARLQESPDLEMKNLLKGWPVDTWHREKAMTHAQSRGPSHGPQPVWIQSRPGCPVRLPGNWADRLRKDRGRSSGRPWEDIRKKWPWCLWAVELLRNEGINESTILWLMGFVPAGRHPAGWPGLKWCRAGN